ncbi:carbohydrate esterase family 4 protein [Cyathus striatus]|nr:carbohydrate esterase family 4 protein [Cyathus striatus]
MLVFLLLVATLAVAGIAFPANEIATRQRAQLITECTIPNTVALSFDDGPYDYLNALVDFLDANNVTGTFFFNGDNWRCIYSTTSVPRVKYAYEHGHQIGSHTWSHTDLTLLSRDQMTQELSRIDNAIQKITGAVPAFLRPPYGNYNDLLLDVAGSRGQAVTLWDFDSEDSLGAAPEEQKSSLDNVIGQNPDTLLSLEHETYWSTVYDVLPYYIQKLKAAGYRMVSVAECVGEKPYTSIGRPSVRDSSWVC